MPEYQIFDEILVPIHLEIAILAEQNHPLLINLSVILGWRIEMGAAPILSLIHI